MPASIRDTTKHAHASKRRSLQAQERLERDCRPAPPATQVLEQALEAVGLPTDLVAAIAGRLRKHQQLWGKIVGVMFPPLLGCRPNTALCRVRGWEQNLPARLRRALPQRSGMKRLRRWGLEGLRPLWRSAASKRAATRSRWPWPWGGDAAGGKK
jgi:hypothetical protein